MSLTADAHVATKVATFPEVGARLVAGVAAREDLEQYRSTGGYAAVTDAERLLDAVEAAALRGRGGAAFPTSRKIETVRTGRGIPVVVANGEEGEPASVKDRWLLRHRPHLVLDGLRLAALMAGSEDVHVYVSDQAGAASVRRAAQELSGAGVWDVDVTVTVVDPAYVAGEETAVVRALNGGPALPMDKPPRPFEEGVAGRPTLVNNVETLANLPLIQRLGAAGYREAGTAASPGTFLLTLTGCAATGLYEIPFGETLRSVLSWLGEDHRSVAGVLMGGYFSGVLGPHALDVPLDYDSLRAVESGLGCGAVGVISRDTCPVAVSAAVLAYFARENAGQCGSCFNGTAAMSAVLDALVEHRAGTDDMERLIRWSTFLRGRGACGTLDGATNVTASLLREFPDLVSRHLHGLCDLCDSGRRVTGPPFAVILPPRS
ncbi:NADH-ubiquinone oxidoreductase-F iron-sulfur binding region domain-containing protein [Dactylosporangium sp. AC04546]|uniref:NADH-ubiquinone oxidoreductase-F iron-sulfur binding region domain-containing protein n=1 Tax=Dactylosporangium sp. AC04546 TaxID=2862460 RepID=UPI001EDE9171|nr:NADH-ubiquinone oxidoreductase-F iron-sulfur binding region domain-containing protein [Dactylosporangium sp. AC04546]WVK87234.1 NADH-ubiquinone oxidoreductase-F iron-sulfur binding region domain-containing protein [Dactylosporangium sp. AC04546]